MKSNRLFIIIVLALMLGNSGCFSQAHTDSISNVQVDSQTSQTGISADSASTSGDILETKINLKIFAPHDQIMLIPASIPDYYQGVANGDELFYSLSDDRTRWEPVTYKISKIASITGRSFYETSDSTIDIYKVAIGEWTGYYKYSLSDPQDHLESRILLENDGLDYAPRSKDYSILQIFDDLYAVSSDDNLKMISNRKIDSYDYDTISKSGIGDIYAWAWTTQPVCSLKDNLIFYRTARDKQFYSIWMLDLDSGTEKRFGKDVVYDLGGIGNRQLIANIRDEVTGIYHGKLVSTSNPESFTTLSKSRWQSLNGWVYLWDVNQIALDNGGSHIDITTKGAYGPLSFAGDMLWFADINSNTQTRFIRLDMKNSTYSIGTARHPAALEEWIALLDELNSDSTPFTEANDQVISIIVK